MGRERDKQHEGKRKNATSKTYRYEQRRRAHAILPFVFIRTCIQKQQQDDGIPFVGLHVYMAYKYIHITHTHMCIAKKKRK
jgi:hypothetical protein